MYPFLFHTNSCNYVRSGILNLFFLFLSTNIFLQLCMKGYLIYVPFSFSYIYLILCEKLYSKFVFPLLINTYDFAILYEEVLNLCILFFFIHIQLYSCNSLGSGTLNMFTLF